MHPNVFSRVMEENTSRQLAKEYKDRFKSATATEVLEFFLNEHRGRIAFATSLGLEDQVITDMISRINKDVRIFTLDTGRLFPESYDLLDLTSKRYHLDIEVYFPDSSRVEQMVRSRGINLFYESVENRKLCCHIRKIEPLRRALANSDVWMSGLRREQSVTRQNGSLVEFDELNKKIKVNPLIDWSLDDVRDYIREHKVPYNKLHDQGFPSIGCLPCTRAVEEGEDIRSGRWWWEDPAYKECGLHKR